MQLQHLLSATRRAVQDYDMIKAGDKIAIGISGGKDSLVLALALSLLKRFYPASFEVIGITVSLGFEPFDVSKINKFFQTIDTPFYVCDTQIGKIIFEERQETNPCSLCSKMRKGALYNLASKYGCNKVALGHNKDDVNESLLMSLFYEGRIHTMPPVNYMDMTELEIIRPLVYISEKDIRGFAKKQNLPVIKSPCPVDGKTKREEMKNLILSLEKTIPGLSEHLFGAVKRSTLPGWNNKKEGYYE